MTLCPTTKALGTNAQSLSYPYFRNAAPAFSNWKIKIETRFSTPQKSNIFAIFAIITSQNYSKLETIGPDFEIVDSTVCAIFVKKDGGAGAITGGIDNIVTRPKQGSGYVIIVLRSGRSCMFYGTPSVRYFRRRWNLKYISSMRHSIPLRVQALQSIQEMIPTLWILTITALQPMGISSVRMNSWLDIVERSKGALWYWGPKQTHLVD